MSAPKLSLRMKLLLALIREGTVYDDAGQLASYWIPRRNPMTCDLTMSRINVSGAGDASCLRALARTGLVKHIKDSPISPYAYRCTEDGMVYYENVLRAELPGMKL